MTRTGAAKSVDITHALGRLRKALAFHELARLALDHIDRVRDPDVVAATAVLSAIAYADALTAAYGGRVNQKDHATAVRLVRDTLGKAFPDGQERRLVRLLGRKDEVQYGARPGRSDDARQIVENLDGFGRWAQDMLAERSVRVSAVEDDHTTRGS